MQYISLYLESKKSNSKQREEIGSYQGEFKNCRIGQTTLLKGTNIQQVAKSPRYLMNSIVNIVNTIVS